MFLLSNTENWNGSLIAWKISRFVFVLLLFLFFLFTHLTFVPKGGEFFEAIQEMRNKKTKHNRCCICVSTRNEELLQCSKCSIFVHLSCYRSSDICADDEWLCDWCQFSNGFALHETPSSPKVCLFVMYF